MVSGDAINDAAKLMCYSVVEIGGFDKLMLQMFKTLIN